MSIMGNLAALDRYQYDPTAGFPDTFKDRFPEGTPPLDVAQAAAQRVTAPYRRAQERAGTSNLGPLAEALGPKQPWEYALLGMATGPSLLGRAVAAVPPVARTALGALGFGASAATPLSSGEAQGADPKIIAKAVARAVGNVAGASGEVAAKKSPTAENWRMGEIGEPPSAVIEPRAVNPAEIERMRDYTRRYAPLGGEVNLGVDAPPNKRIQTVSSPYRMMYPGIYGNPREIAETAAQRVAPEDPMMKRLFGVTRGDLDEITKARPSSAGGPQVVEGKGVARGSTAAENVMTPRNVERLQDVLHEGGLIPGIKHADAWYMLDPLYWQFEKMYGPKLAPQAFKHWNETTGMASPGSDVLTEIQRGTAAHWLQKQGRFEDFMKYGGLAESKRGGMPADMRYIEGHPYHGTSHGGPMRKYFDTGELRSEKPKVPLYVGASGVPQTGYQTIHPVGDAHWSRGVGLADTRKGPTDVGSSFSRSEWQTLSPWWREQIAAPLGIEGVPAQARLWTVLAPQTGVDTAVGQGKLELLSQQVAKAAARNRVSPEDMLKKMIAGSAGVGAIPLAPKMGELFRQDQQ